MRPPRHVSENRGLLEKRVGAAVPADAGSGQPAWAVGPAPYPPYLNSTRFIVLSIIHRRGTSPPRPSPPRGHTRGPGDHLPLLLTPQEFVSSVRNSPPCAPSRLGGGGAALAALYVHLGLHYQHRSIYAAHGTRIKGRTPYCHWRLVAAYAERRRGPHSTTQSFCASRGTARRPCTNSTSAAWQRPFGRVRLEPLAVEGESVSGCCPSRPAPADTGQGGRASKPKRLGVAGRLPASWLVATSIMKPQRCRPRPAPSRPVPPGGRRAQQRPDVDCGPGLSREQGCFQNRKSSYLCPTPSRSLTHPATTFARNRASCIHGGTRPRAPLVSKP